MGLSFEQHCQYVAELVARTNQLLERTDPTAPVPGCPEWDAAELRDHCAGVLAFWIQQLQVADPEAGQSFDDEIRNRYQLPLVDLGAEVTTELRTAGPDRPCWNWSGADQHSGWVARRMANEFSVHCCDALAAADLPRKISPDLAADGIDELIDVFLDADPDADFQSVGTVMLDAGTAGSWVLEIGEGVRRTRRQPSAWVRGSVDQILLDLWGRPSDANHQGDRKPMNHLRKIAVFG